MYAYIHDEAARTVYRYSLEPMVHSTNRNHKPVEWHVAMNVSITRADNVLVGQRWRHPIAANPEQSFEASRYSKVQAIRYFLDNNAPRGTHITETEYLELHARYEAIALAAVPDPKAP